MTSLKRKNVRRLEVEAVIREQGPMTRIELQTHFGVRQATMQEHLSALRITKRIFVADWSPPDGPGNWAPMYAVRVKGDEKDKPQPPSVRRSKATVLLDEDEFPQVVLREEGVRTDHALMARARFEEAGMWGALLLPLQHEGFTRKPRMAGAT